MSGRKITHESTNRDDEFHPKQLQDFICQFQGPICPSEDKNFIAQPKINLQSFKSTPDSLKQRFKAFGRKPSLGAPDNIELKIHN